MTRLIYGVIAILIWPAVLWQLVSAHLGSDKSINQLKASQAEFETEGEFWLNAEPIISGLVALGFIYYGWAWVGLYIALGTLVALAYEKIARGI
jgi:hypothetical protein